LYFAFKLFEKAFPYKNLQILACLLLAVWPSEVMASARLGNDEMTYFLFSISLYCLYSWSIAYKRFRLLLLSIFFASLTTLVKLTGLLLFPLILLTFVYKTINSYQKYYTKRNLLASVVFAMVLAISLVYPIVRSIHETGSPRIIGNSAIFDTERISIYGLKNNPENYLFFDLKSFVSSPFLSMSEDYTGRQYFWNYLLKSSLFGQFSLKSTSYHVNLFFSSEIKRSIELILRAMNEPPVLAFMTSFVNLVFLLMLLFALFGSLKEQRKEKGGTFCLFFNLIISIAALMYVRYTYPYSSSNDFRYILPAVISFIYFYVEAIEILRLQKYRRLVILGYGLASIFVVGVVAIFFLFT
jgi:hypothetical protein